jgi:hypothetical protein
MQAALQKGLIRQQLSSLHTPFSLLITRVVAVVGKSEIYDGRHFVEWEEQIQPEMELIDASV